MLRRIQKVFTEAARSKQFVQGAKFNSQKLNNIPFTNDLNKIDNMIEFRNYFIQHSPFTSKNNQFTGQVIGINIQRNNLVFKQMYRRRFIAILVGLGIIFAWDNLYGIGFNYDWSANYNTHRRRKIFGNLRNGARQGGDADD